MLLDGEMWGPVLGVGDIFDNLHADGDLPPTVAVLVDTMGRRMEDLACSAPFVDWLADTLLPWTEQEYGAGADAARTVVAGQSAGGLTAAFAAFQRPDRFGLALSQSGSFWWPDDDRRANGSPAGTPGRSAGPSPSTWRSAGRSGCSWRRTAGSATSCAPADTTCATGSSTAAATTPCWRGGLADGLAALLGP
ncbi:Enterochelin esterase OS=Streptomyces microflavus OX=1919 GN=fes PE=3 SV=1 [Streptomyces microflavus]